MSKVNRTKGIILDWDDTIIDYNYYVRTKWLNTTKWVENNLGIRGFDAKFWELYDTTSIYSFHKVRDTLHALGLNDSEVSELTELINTHSHSERGEDLIFPYVKRFLKQLKHDGWKIALLTMGFKGTHEQRIKQTGLYPYFDIIMYGDKDSKPSMIPFLACAKELGIKNPIVVGDDQRDLLAPHHMGWEAILIDHKGFNRPIFTDSITKVKSFKELNKYLGRRRNGKQTLEKI